jgi:hypothetical protein
MGVDAKYRTLVRRRNQVVLKCVTSASNNEERRMGRGILLWLLGVPIPVIILLWLFFR